MAPLLSLWGGRPSPPLVAGEFLPGVRVQTGSPGSRVRRVRPAAGGPAWRGGGGGPSTPPPGGSNRPGPSLCPPWAGKIAGVIGDALVMGGATPVLLRFVIACRPGRGPCVVLARWCGLARRSRPPREQAEGAAGARGVRIQLRPSQASRSLLGEGGRPLGPGGGGGPALPRPAGRGESGGGEGGGGQGRAAAPRPPAQWVGPWPPSLSPFVSGAPSWDRHVQSALLGGRGRQARPGRLPLGQCRGGGGKRSSRPGLLPRPPQAGSRVGRFVRAFLGAAVPLPVGCG